MYQISTVSISDNDQINKCLTVRGPVRVMFTCSVYVPGKIKIVRDELSFGKEFTAFETVLNSPEVVVPARTMTAPDGGEVLEAPCTP